MHSLDFLSEWRRFPAFWKSAAFPMEGPQPCKKTAGLHYLGSFSERDSSLRSECQCSQSFGSNPLGFSRTPNPGPRAPKPEPREFMDKFLIEGGKPLEGRVTI